MDLTATAPTKDAAKKVTCAKVELSRAEAFNLYMAALDGEEIFEDNGGVEMLAKYAAYKRAMHAMAITFNFLDHYPEVKTRKGQQ